VPTAPAVAPCLAPGPYDPLPPFAVELLGGQASGVRGQAPLFRDDCEALVVEGFYGYLSHSLGSSQALGAGGRVIWRAETLDCWGSILIGPGVDVFFQLDHNGLILLTPSLDLAWMYTLAPGIGFEVGLDAGLGIGVAGRTKSGNSGLGDLTPLISGYIGLRF
jgi:hypothetical protein